MKNFLYFVVFFCGIGVYVQAKSVGFSEKDEVRYYGEGKTVDSFRDSLQKLALANELISIIKDPRITQLPESASPKSIGAIASTGERPLVTAILNGKYEMSRKLSTLTANPAELSVTKNDEINALHASVLISNSMFVRYFIKRGVEVNSLTGRLGNTPLHLAALNGLETICTVLLNLGADKEITNIDGKTAADLISNKEGGCYKHLISTRTAVRPLPENVPVEAKGLTWSKYDGEPINALHSAVVTYRTAAIKSLALKLGVDSKTELKGKTALHLAVELSSVDSVNILLDAGADPTTKNEKGETAFENALQLVLNRQKFDSQSVILDSMLTRNLIPFDLIKKVSKSDGWKMYHKSKGLGHRVYNKIRKIRGKDYKVTPRKDVDVYSDNYQ